jgi:hypothetical protein
LRQAAHLQEHVFVGLAEDSQDLDGNLLATQQPLPNVPVATSINCSISNQLNLFKCHAFWVQTGRTRQLHQRANVQTLERRVQWELQTLNGVRLRSNGQTTTNIHTACRRLSRDCVSGPRWFTRSLYFTRSCSIISNKASMALASIASTWSRIFL